MELHKDEVPGDTVYAVTVDGPYVQSIHWFITAEASNEAFRDAKADAGDSSFPRKVARWRVELPKRRMDKDAAYYFVWQHIQEGRSNPLDVFITEKEGTYE